jgi:hypothetical protein
MKRSVVMAIALLAVLLAPAARAETVSFQATLILASQDPAPLDPRLDRITYKLRRIFKFEYYRLLGEGEGSVALPGELSVAMGEGHRLQIRAEGKDGGTRAEVRWFKGDTPMLSTAATVKGDAPVILGGVPHEGGTLIVTLIAKPLR